MHSSLELSNSKLERSAISGYFRMRTLSAATTEEYCCQFGSAQYYALCALGGALACGVTHTALTPVDLLKCRIQVQTTDTRQGYQCLKVHVSI